MGDSNIASKLDKLCDKMDSFDKKLDSVEVKLDTRLTMVEQKCSLLEKKSNKHAEQQKYVMREIRKLKSTVNTLEQQRIESNVIIKGVTEIEGDDTDTLSFMVDGILSHIHSEFESTSVITVRRIGVKNSDTSRPILVVMRNSEAKLHVMRNLKERNLHCAQFNHNGKPWGTKEKKIFVSDHLTSVNNNIFYNARQLRKKNKIKYAWTKLGKVYVKKDDVSRAHNISTLEQLSLFERQLESSDEETTVESEADESEAEVETIHTIPEKMSIKKGKRGASHVSPLKVTRSSKRIKPHN